MDMFVLGFRRYAFLYFYEHAFWKIRNTPMLEEDFVKTAMMNRTWFFRLYVEIWTILQRYNPCRP